MRIGSEQIGMGVVGTGLGALLLRANHDPSSAFQVRGIYEPDPARRHERYDADKSVADLADEFGVGFIAQRYEDLLERPDIHCIAVYSPCPYHCKQIVAALEAGKHVVVTKPMAVSLPEARRIVHTVERTGLKLLVSQSMRWNSMFRAIHRLFTSGALGDIQLAESYYLHDMRRVLDASPWRYELPQDYIYGGTCHPVDLLRWFLGEADEVFAYGSHGGIDGRYPADKENNFIISLKYRSGVIARVLGAYDLVHPPALWRESFHGVGIGLYGTKASLFNDRVVYDYYGHGKPKEEFVEPEEGGADHAHETSDMLAHLEDCILNDARPLVDAWDGAQIVAIGDACWNSVHSGLPVKVTQEFDRP